MLTNSGENDRTEGTAGGSEPETEAADRGSEAELRAKYLDFCSAQLTEVVLSLSDERMYQLVEEAARDEDIPVSSLGFSERVRLATQHLRDSVPLPDFETWRREYEANPARFERELLGLWKQVAEERGGGGDASGR